MHMFKWPNENDNNDNKNERFNQNGGVTGSFWIIGKYITLWDLDPFSLPIPLSRIVMAFVDTLYVT